MPVGRVESLVFGVNDLAGAETFCQQFGLVKTPKDRGLEFRALDGASVILLPIDDPTLPPTTVEGPDCRETIWGVDTSEELEALAKELRKDREGRLGDDGVLHSTDDDGRAIAFQVSRVAHYEAEPALANVAGLPPQRPVNTRHDPAAAVRPREIGHVVYFSVDPMRSFAFYRDRLGFVLTDYGENNGGVFARAPGSTDHHSIFFIGIAQLAPKMHHVEFHVTDFEEVLRGGQRLSSAGWETEMGPGRHVIGGNVFWYLKSPFGASFEYGADMDVVDENWTPKEWGREESRNHWRLQYVP